MTPASVPAFLYGPPEPLCFKSPRAVLKAAIFGKVTQEDVSSRVQRLSPPKDLKTNSVCEILEHR